MTVRDSAGIRIVENHDSVWTEETRWRLAEEPDFVIGSFDGSVPGTDFGDLIQARAMGDHVVVSDLISVSLRVFDDAGAFVETLGDRGDGPTELSNAGEWDVLGPDSIVVANLTKTVVFDRGRDEASSYPLTDPPVEAETWDLLGFGWLVRGWFADGTYVMANNPDPRGAEPGYTTQRYHFERMGPDGEYLGPLGAFAMQRFFTTPGGDLAQAPYPTVGQVAVDGRHLWHAFADSLFEVRRVDFETGGVDLLLRVSLPPTEVDDEMMIRLEEFEDRQIERLIEQMGRDADDGYRAEVDRARAENRAAQPEARYAPIVLGLRPLASGHLLVDLPDWEWRLIPNQLLLGDIPADAHVLFAVLDPDGHWLGTFEGPAGLAVTDVTDDYIVGFRKDEFDVPYVERWRIIRP